MRVFIVGYMGSGKTTFGKKLARFLGYEHIDLDHQISEDDGRTIKKVFEEEGEVYFRKLERHHLEKLFQKNNVVISTGGGAATYSNNMELMNENGLTIYMKTTAKALYNRLEQGTSERPMLKGLSESGLYDFIEEHLKKREPHYEKSKLTIDSMQWKKLDLEELKKKMEAFK